jgi:predicted nucleic acid-binding protein
VRLFLDTTAFVAMEDQDDANHRKAVDFRQKIARSETPFRKLYTSNYVIDETLTLLRTHCGHSVAVGFRKTLEASRLVRVFWIAEPLERDAWKIFEKQMDKDYSFTDCSSFALMEDEAIRNVFAFDHHFTQYGFSMVP